MLTIEKKSLKVGKYVDSRHVDTVIRNYKQERWVQNSNKIGKEDSLSVWYSAEELEDYLQKIREYGADGVRFYFAAYPGDYAEHPEYASRQTIVLVATKSRETTTGIVNKDLYIGTEHGSKLLAYNTGTLCPPYCPNGGRTRTPDDDSEWGGIGTTLVDYGDKGMIVV
jgi:hypothetical protein